MKKNWFHNIKKGFGIVWTAAIAVLAVLAVVSIFLGRQSNRPVFWFGHTVLWVETGSMEPSIPERSYILVKDAEDCEVSEGDVITFLCTDETSPAYGYLITHRVIGQSAEGYRTQGDNSQPDTWTVSETDLVAVYVKNLSVLTVCGRIFASPMGLILIFAIFLGSCVFLYLPDIIKAVGHGESTEREKEKLMDELVQKEVERLRNEEGRDKP